MTKKMGKTTTIFEIEQLACYVTGSSHHGNTFNYKPLFRLTQYVMSTKIDQTEGCMHTCMHTEYHIRYKNVAIFIKTYL